MIPSGWMDVSSALTSPSPSPSHRSSSSKGLPAAIFYTFARGCMESESTKAAPVRWASSVSTVDFPAPDTPIRQRRALLQRPLMPGPCGNRREPGNFDGFLKEALERGIEAFDGLSLTVGVE